MVSPALLACSICVVPIGIAACLWFVCFLQRRVCLFMIMVMRLG